MSGRKGATSWRSGRRPGRAGVLVAAAVLLVQSWLSAGTTVAFARPSGNTKVTGLTVEHRENPLGVDAEAPRFGWQMSSSVRGQWQTAYQVLVASAPERLTPSAADVWNSGRVNSSNSVAVGYNGKPLEQSSPAHCAEPGGTGK